MRRYSPNDALAFIDVRGDDECWPWMGRRTTNKNGNGYGCIGIAGETYVAHRVMYWLEHPNTIELRAPSDKTVRQFVLHKCDNRICCNPQHLFLGNYDDNVKDAARKNRTARNHGVKGTNNYAAKLNAEQVHEIRRMSKSGLSNVQIETFFPVCNEVIRRVVNRISYCGV